MTLQPIISKLTKMLLLALAAISIAILMLLLVLYLYSPGKPGFFRDADGKIPIGSMAEKCFVNIGGVPQGMIIRSNDFRKPVLLYIHGGPAFPNFFLIDKYNPGLEEMFTVCYWEQRGGGLSYSPGVTKESMTFEQLTQDGLEVTNYLRKRFGKEKIYLMAHSGGTAFAIQMAARAPELFHAYVGMAQITRQKESERIAYAFMLKLYEEAGNTKAVKKMSEYPVLQSDTNVLPFYKSLVRDECMHALGIGTMHNLRSVFRDIFLPVWTCKAYTLREKFNIWKSKFYFLKKTDLLAEVINTDITATVTSLEIPVYFLSGKYDLTVNHELSKAYLEKLQAPVKGFYTFSESAHSPIYEEPDRMREIFRKDILTGTNRLAEQD